MTDALRRLEAAGYGEQLRASGGLLICLGAQVTGLPGDFHVDEVVRFEGASDPDDEAAVFALTHVPTGTRGTYVVAYGPDMDMADAEIARALG